MGIKKKILLGWLAFELAAIPFAIPTAAKIIKSAAPSTITRTVSVDIPSASGNARMIIASNTPFAVLASGATGKMQVSVHVSGAVNGNAFGRLAQSPGTRSVCSQPASTQTNVIYTAQRATAPNTGPVIDQAVVVEITYNPKLTPVFSVESLDSKAVKSAIKSSLCTA